MAATRIKLNLAGFRKLRRSPEVAADLEKRARRIADAAGPGHEVEVTKGRTRALGMVWTGLTQADDAPPGPAGGDGPACGRVWFGGKSRVADPARLPGGPGVPVLHGPDLRVGECAGSAEGEGCGRRVRPPVGLPVRRFVLCGCVGARHRCGVAWGDGAEGWWPCESRPTAGPVAVCGLPGGSTSTTWVRSAMSGGTRWGGCIRPRRSPAT
jgi:hypothetical protein